MEWFRLKVQIISYILCLKIGTLANVKCYTNSQCAGSYSSKSTSQCCSWSWNKLSENRQYKMYHMVSSVSQSYLRSAHHAEFRPAKTFSRDQLHVHNMQGLIKPKLKEGICNYCKSPDGKI